MMHRCSSGSSGNMMGPCSCGLFHHHQHQYSYPYQHNQTDMYSFMSPPSSVDCTLSLGTPSTRLVSEDERLRNQHQQQQHQRSSSSSSSSCMPNFCWDFLQASRTSPYPPQITNQKPTRGTGTNSSSSSNDPLLARRCANCDTTSTPLWRNGPRGPKSLCNACGIRFKKEERRANANTNGNGMIDHQQQQQQYYHHHHHPHHNSYHSEGQKMACYSNEFRFIEDSEQQSSSSGDTGGIPFLSWRLNVADRSSLVHDFTR